MLSVQESVRIQGSINFALKPGQPAASGPDSGRGGLPTRHNRAWRLWLHHAVLPGPLVLFLFLGPGVKIRIAQTQQNS